MAGLSGTLTLTTPAPSSPIPASAPLQSVSVPEWDPRPAGVSTLYYQEGTEWDYIVIAGVRLSAFVTVEGDKDTRIDVKESQGPDGATSTQLGVSPAPITIKLRFLEPWALGEWAALVPELQPKPGKPRPDAVQVYHPALAINGIKSLFLKSLGVPRPTGPGGAIEVVTRWLEFLPVKKKDAKPKTLGTATAALGGPRAKSFEKKTKPSEGKAGEP